MRLADNPCVKVYHTLKFHELSVTNHEWALSEVGYPPAAPIFKLRRTGKVVTSPVRRVV